MGKKLNYWAKHQKQVSIKTLDQSKEWVKNSKLKQHELEQKIKQKKKEQQEEIETKQVVPIKTKKPEITSQMFFSYNTALGPPYRIMVDTNFINFSVQNKLDIVKASMDCLFAKCDICITDCVIGELEKLGDKFRVALKVAKDPRFIRLKCTHKGIYADDCICSRVESNPIYIVGTCDRDLRRRIRKIPGVPIMYLKNRQYYVERLPDVDQMAKK